MSLNGVENVKKARPYRGMPSAHLAGTIDAGISDGGTSSPAASFTGVSAAPPRSSMPRCSLGDASILKVQQQPRDRLTEAGVEVQPLPDDVLHRLGVLAGMSESDFGRFVLACYFPLTDAGICDLSVTVHVRHIGGNNYAWRRRARRGQWGAAPAAESAIGTSDDGVGTVRRRTRTALGLVGCCAAGVVVTRESAHVAAQRAALGRSLAHHRERSGLNQRELAERLYYDRTSISKIETGQQPAPETFWHEADRLLGAGGELVAGFNALAAVKASDGQAPTQIVYCGGTQADMLADALTVAMLPVARASDKVRSTSADSDQVDAVVELEALSRALSEHSRRVLMGEPADWAEITERLSAATMTCQRRVTVESWAAGRN
jgi:transcriptional regulator with XRE-family HTH domain